MVHFLTFNDIFAKSFVKFFTKTFLKFFTYLEVLCTRFIDVMKCCNCCGRLIYMRCGGSDGDGVYILFIAMST